MAVQCRSFDRLSIRQRFTLDPWANPWKILEGNLSSKFCFIFVGTKSACFSKVVPLPSRAAANGPVELRLSFAFTIPQTASIMFSSLQLSRCTTVSVSLGGVKNPYTTLAPTLKKQHQGVLLGF
jgi:hypothetical protein